MRILLLLLTVSVFFACTEKKQQKAGRDLNQVAKAYVKLGLAIGQYDSDFVDAYYGPDSLKPNYPKLPAFPKDSFLGAVNDLRKELSGFMLDKKDDSTFTRADWLDKQLAAFERRIKIFAGERASFDVESKDLFGAVAPNYNEEYFRNIISQLNAILPGTGDIPERFQKLANHFIIPKNKIDTVFKTAIAESRKRTFAHYSLPSNEDFTLEYVTGKSWSGYNWYKGNYTSNIQINTDIDIFIERAIDVASHESYPGHHVYNMLLEKNLYRDRGWTEISLYPLFSPQSLIAEGSANYGIELAFPGNEKIAFAKNILLPLAGLDTTGIDLYFRALLLKSQLNFVRNEVGRGLLDKKMDEASAIRWLMEYGLSNKETALKSISFIKKYGSYVINYNYGMELVKKYIESNVGVATAPGKRWEAFGKLLSDEVTTDQLRGNSEF